VYNGGNLRIFKKLTNTGATSGEVLYIGDNINHDIIKSKDSKVFWRTCLIVKELDREIIAWKKGKKEYQNMVEQEFQRAKAYQGLDSSCFVEEESTKALKLDVKNSFTIFDEVFNPYFGSLFRSGPSESNFSTQVTRYADLYAADHLHFLNYPLHYYFSPMPKLYAHEEMTNLME